MVRSAMMKKMTLRLLAVALTLMTAVAFMPAAADIVWAADTTDTVASDPNAGEDGNTPETPVIDYDVNQSIGNGSKYIIDISCGNVTIDGKVVSYYKYDAANGKIEGASFTMKEGWYEDNEIIITGTTPAKFNMATIGPDGNPNTSEMEATDIGPNTISINGGPHKITFQNLNMSPALSDSSYTPYAAVRLKSNTEAMITISGENDLTSYYYPGIDVPTSSKLTIREAEPGPGSLTATATGSSDNAGIGGTGEGGYCGEIIIDSGKITAAGSGGGAGIGGSGTGYGTITINGGDITAKGGSHKSGIGSPGIGSGSSYSGGTLTINGGNITALSGTGQGTGTASASAKGIVSQNISSNGHTVIISSTNGILQYPQPTTEQKFNALVWTNPSNNTSATVYGDALLSRDGTTLANGEKVPAFDLKAGDHLTIPGGTTLTVPEGQKYIANGAHINGEGYIIGDIDGFEKIDPDEPKKAISLYAGYTKHGEHPSIEIIGADGHGYPVYDGEPKDLEDLIIIHNPNANNEYLDIDNWNVSVSTSEGDVKLDEIIHADDYTIKFSHKQGAYGDVVISGAKIEPKQFDEYMVNMETPFSYGTPVTFSVMDDSVSLNDGVLVSGKDYTARFYEIRDDGTRREYTDPSKITSVGHYEAVFEGKGNYTSDIDGDGTVTDDERVTIEFDIEPASIKNATVTHSVGTCVYKAAPVYTLNQLKGKFKVVLNNKTLKLNTDYTISFTNDALTPESDYPDQNDHITYAGTVTVTITAINDNYCDTAVTSFEIGKRPVKVETAVAAYANAEGQLIPRRHYDGTNIVNIEDATLLVKSGNYESLIPKDEEFVEIDFDGLEEDSTDDLIGTLKSADAGRYTEVTLKDVRLQGERSNNYKVVESEAALLKPEGFTEEFKGFEITRLPVPVPAIEVTDKLSEGDKEKFQCTVKVTNAPNDGAKYLYGMLEKEGSLDDIKWQTSNTFDKLTSNTNYWFYCKVDDSEAAAKNMYPDPAGVSYKKHKTPLIPQDPPEEFELEFTLDPGGESYTVTIPEQEGAQYSFDGKNFNKSNVLKGVGAHETITGYVRFPATKTHAVSDVVSATDTTPPLTVKTPVISPENGEFYGSVKVSISCATEGATIYYTTDGNHPTPSSNKYSAPFTLTENTTIIAIAVKDDMNESEVARVDYVYTEYEPQTEAKVSSGIKITNDLKTSPTYNQKDSITAALSRAITEDGGGYTYQNIAYYDLNVKISFDNGVKFVNATADNFPEEGVEVTVPFPKNTGESSHDFRVAHMFSETSDRLGTTAGEIEKPDVTESAAGLTFTVNGCSPLAIGWVETGDENAAGADGENADDEGGNAADGEDADTLNANGEAANGENADGANGAGANANGGANADGTGADGENADGTGGSGAGGVVDELVNAVTTGDYTNPILWAAIALVSLLFIIIIVAVRRRA